MAVRTIGTGGDFSTPRAWEASLPATLTEPETARLLIQDFSSLSDVNATFDINVLTSATNFITIEADSGDQDFRADSTTVPFFTYARGGTFGIVTARNNCNHLLVRGITVNITAAQTNLILDVRTTIPTDSFLRFENLYAYATGAGSGCTQFRAGTIGYMRNSICVTNGFRALDSATNFEYTNNTVVGNFTGDDIAASGIRRNTAGSSQRNAAFNFGPTSGNRDYLQSAATFVDNASSDESGNVGFRNLSLAEQYTDPENHDWSFLTGNGLEGAATGGADIGVVLPASGDERTGVFSDVVTALSSFVGAKESTGVLADVVNAASNFVGDKEGLGVFADTLTAASNFVGQKEATGTFADTLTSTPNFVGQKEATGTFQDILTASSIFIGVAEIPTDDRTGVFSDVLTASSTFTGQKESSGVFADSLNAASTFTGQKESTGVFSDVLTASSNFVGISSETPIFISEFTIQGRIEAVTIQGDITEKTITGRL